MAEQPDSGYAVTSPAPAVGSAMTRPPLQSSSKRVALIGSILHVDGKPFTPIALQYNGEPFELVKELGFNTIWLDRPPTTDLLLRAQAAGVWVICPPLPMVNYDARFNGVLMWLVGRNLLANQLPEIAEQIRATKQADAVARRPVMLSALGDTRGYSRNADIILLERQPIGCELNLSQFGEWLRRRPNLARAGTPFFTVIQTQSVSPLARQARIFDQFTGTGALLPDQQRMLVQHAVRNGMRGMLFLSRTSLTAADADTRLRAHSLYNVNTELEIIKSFTATGTLFSDCKVKLGTDGPAVSQPKEQISDEAALHLDWSNVEGKTLQYPVASTLRVDRARLVTVTWEGAGGQWTCGKMFGRNVKFIIPGAPLAAKAYLVRPGSLIPLATKRVAGGTQIILEQLGPTAYILLTEDPLVIRKMSELSRQIAQPACQSELNTARLRRDKILRLRSQLARYAFPIPPGEELFNRISANEKVAQEALGKNLYHNFYGLVGQMNRDLRTLENEAWQSTVEAMATLARSTPFSRSLETLTTMVSFARTLQVPGSQFVPRTVGGEAENREQMTRAGWRYFVTPDNEQLVTAMALEKQCAKSGEFGLRIAVTPANPQQLPALVESPPAWISAPVVPLLAGETARISAWVYIPKAITGSPDGLLVADNIAGETLAARVKRTGEWTQVVLYRTAPKNMKFSVNFLLTGLGEAWLDDLQIEVLEKTSNAKK